MNAQIIPSRSAVEAALMEAYGAAKATLPGSAEVANLRERAFNTFAAAGLPHRRIEAWHYTDLRALMREALPIVPVPNVEAIATLTEEIAAAGGLPPQSLVLVDGVFVPELSGALPAGVAVTSLASVLAGARGDLLEALAAGWIDNSDSVIALNAALMQDGVVIEVAPGTELAAPINLVYATAAPVPAGRFSRSLAVVGAGARVRFHELSFAAGARRGQTNNCLILNVGDEADVSHTAALTQSEIGSVRLESCMIKLGARAKFDSFALITGGGLVRRQIFMRFEGAQARAALRGVSLLRGREHADTTLFVDHVAQGCESRETFRYIVDEEATGVFQGKIIVAPGAQKTDGKMLSKALLLSDTAAMNNKPELEIFADDVACGHGATCGGLSQEQLFYLQSRGLPFVEAEALLLAAFGGELIDEIGHEELAAAFRADVAAWLASRSKGKTL
ncbi:MAG: SufB/SufD family protein [Beijerinckiaceae bacterium]